MLHDIPRGEDGIDRAFRRIGRESEAVAYTNDIQRDPPWLMGLILPSDVQIAKVDLSRLEEAALENE